MRNCNRGFQCTLTLICLASIAGQADARNYIWNRTNADVWERTTVVANAQAETSDPDPILDESSTGTAATSNVAPASGPALGGQGGAGGAGGAGAEDGLDGIDGQDGSASAQAHADGIGSLSPDGQLFISWSFIHNQDATITLSAGGGGGGGGGGGIGLDMGMPDFGDPGVEGGRGADAGGVAMARQESGADVQATLQFDPNADPNASADTIGRIAIDIGWVSSGNLQDFQGEPIWTRTTNIQIRFADAALDIMGGPTGPISCLGQTSNGTWFYKEGPPLESDTGTFGIGLSEQV